MRTRGQAGQPDGAAGDAERRAARVRSAAGRADDRRCRPAGSATWAPICRPRRWRRRRGAPHAAVVGLGVVNGDNLAASVAEVRRVERELPPTTELWLGGREAAAVAASMGPTRAIVLDQMPYSRTNGAPARCRARAGLTARAVLTREGEQSCENDRRTGQRRHRRAASGGCAARSVPQRTGSGGDRRSHGRRRVAAGAVADGDATGRRRRSWRRRCWPRRWWRSAIITAARRTAAAWPRRSSGCSPTTRRRGRSRSCASATLFELEAEWVRGAVQRWIDTPPRRAQGGQLPLSPGRVSTAAPRIGARSGHDLDATIRQLP